MTSGMNYKQGDIVLLPFPYSDLSSAKKRPALVLSNNKFNGSSDDIACCLITTNPKKDELSIAINDADVSNGKLHFESRIKPYRLFTVEKRIVVRKICSLKKAKFNETIEKLSEIISQM